ncbi:ceramidase domain-containing protein [Dactylosporangium aurantiacum]|uniref:Ceramidase domain-containing protein n=1 Tax=Dactylosporangium aurantiacum TaxID=35754 RepID=A0A9Q9IAX7_9ACTN|nr:ceramidase domain-containing protein [Dactylosporangium aurantiacum]MDG6101766.1 ceramidase domain-containing protein [Dactylosporangium aurantiacum]UWZ52426.1 ceramidase domain-containing protein [Dactylosporangium aurantiacum]
MDRDRRPITAAVATAAVSCGLLAAALRWGWLGPDAGRGAEFCEAGRDWVVRQPANTFSNAGFVAAGLLIAWHAGARPDPGAGAGPRRRATALACLVVLLGPGSAAMHATQSVLGGHLDLLSMYLIAAFAAASATTRWLRAGTAVLAGVFAGAVAACEAAGAWDVRVPVVLHPGNAAFGLLLLTAAALEIAIIRRDRTAPGAGFAYAAIAVLLVAFAVWNAAQAWLCDPRSPLQGHAAWHLLCAVSAYLLYRYYAATDLVVRRADAYGA